MKMQSITDLKQAIEIQIQKRKSAEKPILTVSEWITWILLSRLPYISLIKYKL